MNSRSDWLKSEAEHYQHCYQQMKNVSPCLCLHKWLIFRIFTVSSCITKQFDKFSTKVLEIWKNMWQMCIILSNNDIALNKNVICNISLV